MEWLVGFVAAAFFHFLQLFRRIFRGLGFRAAKQDIIEGKWYGCHYSRLNYQAILRREECYITRRNKNTFNVRFSAEEDYRGHLVKERGHLVIHLQGIGSYQAHFDIRLQEPIPGKDRIMPGLWMSFDFDGRLIAGPIVFSRDLLTDDEATRYLRSLVEITRLDNRLLGLTSQNLKSHGM